jgi:SAM-dependent methyltransferase
MGDYNEDLFGRMWRYARYHPPETTPWWPTVRELAETAPRRLELGPGPWPKLPVEGTHFVDFSEVALEHLQAHGGVGHRGTLAEAGFAERGFDLVGAFEILEHVEDDVGLLAEIARVTAPGGHFVMSVPLGMRWFNEFDQFLGHVRRYEPDELRDKLARAGFEPLRFSTFPYVGGPRLAALYIGFVRAFPRFGMWLSDRLVSAMHRSTVLEWFAPGEWAERTADAADVSVVCARR